MLLNEKDIQVPERSNSHINNLNLNNESLINSGKQQFTR